MPSSWDDGDYEQTLHRCESDPDSEQGFNACRSVVAALGDGGDPRGAFAVAWRACRTADELCIRLVSSVHRWMELRLGPTELEQALTRVAKLCLAGQVVDHTGQDQIEGLCGTAIRTFEDVEPDRRRAKALAELACRNARVAIGCTLFKDWGGTVDAQAVDAALAATNERRRGNREAAAEYGAEIRAQRAQQEETRRRRAEEDRQTEELMRVLFANGASASSGASSAPAGTGQRAAPTGAAGAPTNADTSTSPTCSGRNMRWCPPTVCNHQHGYCGTACDACP